MLQGRSIGLFVLPACLVAGSASAQITLEPIGQHVGGAGAEIAAYDPGTRRVFSVNTPGKKIDVIDITNPAAPALLFVIDVSTAGTPNSVAVSRGIVAVAVENPVRTDPGRVLFFDVDGNPLSEVTVGALPDMVTFTHNGRKVLVANEGEPNANYTIDPEGSVSIIDLTGGVASLTDADVTTASFDHFDAGSIDPNIRIFGANNPTVAQDVEPEYIAVSHDSKTAWVTLQENNALAILDIEAGIFTEPVPLGFKDHRLPGNGLDASDRDGAINIRNWPVFGMYLPDGLATFRVGGETYLVTANEGDSRDFSPFFNEEARVGGLNLDPTAFPDGATLKEDANLGRLRVTNTRGDTDGDGDYDELYAFGARSFSVWTAAGDLLFDSGDQFERITAAALPTVFNDSGDNRFDSRSDDKGPEPEGVVVGKAFGRQYAFITLERIGGVMVYDVSSPHAPRFVQYINTRATGDRAPEGVTFITEEESPTGHPLLVVSNEVSGTTRIFEIRKDS